MAELMGESIKAALSEVREWLLSPLLLGIVVIFCGAVLFLPDDVAQQVGFQKYRDEFRPAFGTVLLLALSGLAARAIMWGLAEVNSKRQRSKMVENRRSLLTQLSGEEREVLRRFVILDTSTMHFAPGDGTAGALVANDILYCSGMMDWLKGMPMSLQPWVRNLLQQDEGAVGTPEEYEATKQRMTAEQNRGRVHSNF